MIHNSSPSSGAAAAKRAIDPEDNNPAVKKARSSSEEAQRTSPGLLSPNEKTRSRSNSACGNELEIDVKERLVAISEKDKRLIVKFEKPEIQLLDVLRELEKVSSLEIVCFRQVKHKSSKVDYLFAKGRKDETSNFRHLLLVDCKNKDLESARMKFGKNEAKVKKAITANNATEADKLRRNLIDFDSNKGLFLYNTKEAAEICKPVRADKVQEQFFATSYVDEFLNPGKLFSYLNGLLDEEKETVALFFPKGVSEWKTKTSIEQSKGQWSWLNSVLSQFEKIENRSTTSTEGKDYTNKLGQCLKEALEKYVGENDCEDAHVQNLIEMIRSESEEK